MQKVTIVVPAYNEEQRIGTMLEAYGTFFNERAQADSMRYELLVVLNNCTDNTLDVVQELSRKFPSIKVLTITQAGKGIALKAGFLHAVQEQADIIGFVDADMATLPTYFNELLENLTNGDGVIASRYMQGAQVYPPRPFIKRWGSRLIYEPLIKLLFGLQYTDFQCGAKVFKRTVISRIAPAMQMRQWATDVEILYLCKLHGFTIKEIPTVWYDRAGSKLRMMSGFKMLASLVKLRLRQNI